jgi:hypothetical protein
LCETGCTVMSSPCQAVPAKWMLDRNYRSTTPNTHRIVRGMPESARRRCALFGHGIHSYPLR